MSLLAWREKHDGDDRTLPRLRRLRCRQGGAGVQAGSWSAGVTMQDRAAVTFWRRGCTIAGSSPGKVGSFPVGQLSGLTNYLNLGRVPQLSGCQGAPYPCRAVGRRVWGRPDFPQDPASGSDCPLPPPTPGGLGHSPLPPRRSLRATPPAPGAASPLRRPAVPRPGNLPWCHSGIHVPEDLRHGEPVPGSPSLLSPPDPPAPVPGSADPAPAAAPAVPRSPPPVRAGSRAGARGSGLRVTGCRRRRRPLRRRARPARTGTATGRSARGAAAPGAPRLPGHRYRGRQCCGGRREGAGGTAARAPSTGHRAAEPARRTAGGVGRMRRQHRPRSDPAPAAAPTPQRSPAGHPQHPAGPGPALGPAGPSRVCGGSAGHRAGHPCRDAAGTRQGERCAAERGRRRRGHRARTPGMEERGGDTGRDARTEHRGGDTGDGALGKGHGGCWGVGTTEHRGPPTPETSGWGTPGDTGKGKTGNGATGDGNSWEQSPGLPGKPQPSHCLCPWAVSGQGHGSLTANCTSCWGAAVDPGSPDPHPHRADSVLAMAAAQLVTWGMLLATGVPAKAQGVLPAELSLSGDPSHGPAWGQQGPGPSPAWEASGEPSGAGAPRSERWGVQHPVHWSPPLQAGDGARAPLEMETTTTGADTEVWRDGSTVPAVTEEPLAAWRGHETEGQDSSGPRGSAVGTLGPEVPTDRGADSPGPLWAGQGLFPSRQSESKTPGTPSPQPTVSTIALEPTLAPGTRTADAPTGGHTAAEGPAAAPGLSQDAQLSSGSSQSIPLSTAPVAEPTGTGPAWAPHASPGSALGSWGDTGGSPSPSPALPSSAPRLRHTAPFWGLAEPWTRALPSHQRSTRRAPLSHATTSAGDAAPSTDPGTTGQRRPQPGPGSVLSTGPAPAPASSTAIPGTPSRGRSQRSAGESLGGDRAPAGASARLCSLSQDCCPRRTSAPHSRCGAPWAL